MAFLCSDGIFKNRQVLGVVGAALITGLLGVGEFLLKSSQQSVGGGCDIVKMP